MLDRRYDTDKALTGREVLAVGTRVPPHVDQVRPDLADQLLLLVALGLFKMGYRRCNGLGQH